jgi:hypothetical protein
MSVIRTPVDAGIAAPRYTSLEEVKEVLGIPAGNVEKDDRITQAIVAGEYALDAELGGGFAAAEAVNYLEASAISGGILLDGALTNLLPAGWAQPQDLRGGASWAASRANCDLLGFFSGVPGAIEGGLAAAIRPRTDELPFRAFTAVTSSPSWLVSKIAAGTYTARFRFNVKGFRPGDQMRGGFTAAIDGTEYLSAPVAVDTDGEVEVEWTFTLPSETFLYPLFDSADQAPAGGWLGTEIAAITWAHLEEGSGPIVEMLPSLRFEGSGCEAWATLAYQGIGLPAVPIATTVRNGLPLLGLAHFSWMIDGLRSMILQAATEPPVAEVTGNAPNPLSEFASYVAVLGSDTRAAGSISQDGITFAEGSLGDIYDGRVPPELWGIGGDASGLLTGLQLATWQLYGGSDGGLGANRYLIAELEVPAVGVIAPGTILPPAPYFPWVVDGEWLSVAGTDEVVIPEAVRQASLEVAIATYKSPDGPMGTAGSDAYSFGSVDTTEIARTTLRRSHVLRGFKLSSAFGVA